MAGLDDAISSLEKAVWKPEMIAGAWILLVDARPDVSKTWVPRCFNFNLFFFAGTISTYRVAWSSFCWSPQLWIVCLRVCEHVNIVLTGLLANVNWDRGSALNSKKKFNWLCHWSPFLFLFCGGKPLFSKLMNSEFTACQLQYFMEE
jgi:hypothetical protein